MMNRSVLNDNCIPLSPVLAEKIGLNEAIVVQQVHYWIDMYRNSKDEKVKEKHFRDGKWWIYNTYDEWHKQFPFWSVITIKRTFISLKKMKLIQTGEYNSKKYDRTKWYTIDYEILESLVNTDSINLIQSSVSNCNNPSCHIDTTYTIDYTENNYSIDKQLNDSCITFFPKTEKSQSVVLNFNITEKQIKKYCKENNYVEYMDNLIETFRYFYDDYKRCFGKDHTILSQKNIDNTCYILIDFAYNTLGDYELHDYQVMIYHYLRTDYKKRTNYSILHFTTEGIMNNLYYKYVYQAEDEALDY